MRVLKALTQMMSPRLLWTRITFSKITTTFFLLALFHCIVQVALEAFAYSVNVNALTLLQTIVATGAVNTTTGVAIFQNQNLTICKGIPSTSSCQVVWSEPTNVEDIPEASTPAPTAYADMASSTDVVDSGVSLVSTSESATSVVSQLRPTQIITVLPSSQVLGGEDHGRKNDAETEAEQEEEAKRRTSTTFSKFSGLTAAKRNVDASIVRQVNSTGGLVGVLIMDPHLKGGKFLASPTCVQSLQVPIQSLRNVKRVDLTFVSFQVWVLGMSIVALLNESVPHIIASLLTHLLATAWSGYQLHLTEVFRKQVTELVINGPCHANLLPEYWQPRRNTEISVAVLNAAVMVAMAFLSYKLIKSFGWQTFKRIGASLVISRVYQLVLGFSIIIQLCVFFIGANVVLWVDQLYNGNIARYAEHRGVYEVVYITLLSILLPWLTMGWFAVRRESRFWMHVFIILACLMIGGWAMMFASNAFTWTFKSWDFFAVMTIISVILLVATLVLGIVVRLNFGRGLPAQLNAGIPADEPSFVRTDEKDADYYDDEKDVEFPSRKSSPVPTFSVAFGTGEDALPSLLRLAEAGRPAPGFGLHARGGSVDVDPPAYPAAVLTHGNQSSPSSYNSESPVGTSPPRGSELSLSRMDSGASQSSYDSGRRQNSDGRMGGRRWLIE